MPSVVSAVALQPPPVGHVRVVSVVALVPWWRDWPVSQATFMSTPANLPPDTRPLMRRRPASSTGGETTTAATTTTNPGQRDNTKASIPESSCLLAIRALLPPLCAGAEDGGPGRRKPVQHPAHRRKTHTEPVGQLALAAQPSAAKELARTLPSSPPGHPAARNADAMISEPRAAHILDGIEIDPGAAEIVTVTARSTVALLEPPMKVSPTRSCGRTDWRAVRRWSFGIRTMSGSRSTTWYCRS